jgi:RNA polymerase sigma factor (sigma-70 family)
LAETGRRIRVAARALPHVPQRLISDERLVALVRRGEPAAFERLYDRYAAALLSFCFFILGSREDAEDALQSTFASAYRALLRDERAIELRPWLFAIARNACIGIVRKRRPQESEQLARIAGEDMLARVERRERIRDLLAAMLELPERHRTALILAELHGHSQREIGQLLGVSSATVKSYIFQARTTLASERTAREADCHEIREELASARGAALLRGRLRRHLRSCTGCREYADQVARRRRELGALLPLLPSLALKRRVLDATAGKTGAGAGVLAAGAGGTAGVATTGVVELGGAGAKALLAKALIAVTGLGAGAGAGTLALGVASSQPATPGPARLGVASAPARQSPKSISALGGGAAPDGLPGGGAPSAQGQPGAPGSASDPSRVAPPPAAGSHPAETAHPRSSGAGPSAGAGSEAEARQAEASTGHGNANGHSAEHGNSAAAHAGGDGNAGGSSAEHPHGQGNGRGNGGADGNGRHNGNSGGDGDGHANGHSEAKATARENREAKGHAEGPANGSARGEAKGRSESSGTKGNGSAAEAAHGAAGSSSGPPAAKREPPPSAAGVGKPEEPELLPAPASGHGGQDAGTHEPQGGTHEPQGAAAHEPQGHGPAKS